MDKIRLLIHVKFGRTCCFTFYICLFFYMLSLWAKLLVTLNWQIGMVDWVLYWYIWYMLIKTMLISLPQFGINWKQNASAFRVDQSCGYVCIPPKKLLLALSSIHPVAFGNWVNSKGSKPKKVWAPLHFVYLYKVLDWYCRNRKREIGGIEHH